MGIDYYLVKHGTKEGFELGKGRWNETMLDKPEVWVSESALLEAIALTLKATFTFDTTKEAFTYAFNLRDALWKFANGQELKLVFDEDWYELRDIGYKLDGSRYEL